MKQFNYLQPKNTTSKLKCFYGKSESKWLSLGPFKIEENSHDPQHVTIHNILFEHECDKITEFLGPMLNFPPGRMNSRKMKNDWTMKKYAQEIFFSFHEKLKINLKFYF